MHPLTRHELDLEAMNVVTLAVSVGRGQNCLTCTEMARVGEGAFIYVMMAQSPRCYLYSSGWSQPGLLAHLSDSPPQSSFYSPRPAALISYRH